MAGLSSSDQDRDRAHWRAPPTSIFTYCSGPGMGLGVERRTPGNTTRPPFPRHRPTSGGLPKKKAQSSRVQKRVLCTVSTGVWNSGPILFCAYTPGELLRVWGWSHLYSMQQAMLLPLAVSRYSAAWSLDLWSPWQPPGASNPGATLRQ